MFGKKEKTNTFGPTGEKGSIIKSLWASGHRKLTVMFIPHSAKQPLNFQVSVFALLAIAVAFLTVTIGAILLTASASGEQNTLSSRTEDLENTQASLEAFRTEVGALLGSAKSFQEALAETLSNLGISSPGGRPLYGRGGDLEAFFNTETVETGSLEEVLEVRRLASLLDQSALSLDQVSMIYSKQSELLTDIPTMWPIRGVRGAVTSVFGPSRDPFDPNGRWYLHKGMDLAAPRGVPVVATARGKVVEAEIHKSYGKTVVVQHRYGFYTRYAHMDRLYVTKGQELRQGDIIGTVGNTGLSTGPHLHYEVIIGAQVVDPFPFLNMPGGFDPYSTTIANLQPYR